MSKAPLSGLLDSTETGGGGPALQHATDHCRRKVRVFSPIAPGKAGKIAESLIRLDLIALHDLG
jgi:hypothetical protein